MHLNQPIDLSACPKGSTLYGGRVAHMRVKPGVHTNDFATIHGRPVRIHTAPAEDNTSNQQSTPQALCEYWRGDRESWRNR